MGNCPFGPLQSDEKYHPRSLLDDDPVHLLQEYLGGEGRRDRGEDRAHRPVGDPVAVAGQLEGHPVQILEHVDAPEIENERGIVKKEYSIAVYIKELSKTLLYSSHQL